MIDPTITSPKNTPRALSCCGSRINLYRQHLAWILGCRGDIPRARLSCHLASIPHFFLQISLLGQAVFSNLKNLPLQSLDSLSLGIVCTSQQLRLNIQRSSLPLSVQVSSPPPLQIPQVSFSHQPTSSRHRHPQPRSCSLLLNYSPPDLFTKKSSIIMSKLFIG